MGNQDKFPKQPPSPDKDRDTGKSHPSPDWDRATRHPPLEKVDTPERWPGPPDHKDRK